MTMHLTSRANRDECDFELEDWEYPEGSGVSYCMVGVITIPERLDDEGLPIQNGPESVEITQVQTYNDTKQDWENNLEALTRLKDDSVLHTKLIESFWDQCCANEEKRQEDMAERR